MRYIIALLLCAQVLLLGACGDEKSDLNPPSLSLESSEQILNYLQNPTKDSPIHLSGTTDSDASIDVEVSSAASFSNLTNSDGVWAFDLTPAEGRNRVVISASDKRGNYNKLWLTLVHDTTPPVVTIDQYLSPTAATSQIVGGIVESGATVVVTAGTATVGPLTLNKSFWSCPISELTVDGDYSISVTATDPTGNISTPVTQTIIVNSTAPLLSIDMLNPTRASTVTLTGGKAPGYTVSVVPPAGVTAEAVIYLNTDANWSCVLSGLKSGKNLVTVSLDTPTSPPTAKIVVVRDNVAPVITAVRPLAGYTTSAAAVTEVTAIFNEQLDLATINATTFLLKDALGSDVPGAVSYDPATRMASFVPTTLPLVDGIYTATVKTGVKDLLENAMPNNKIWTFTIKAP